MKVTFYRSSSEGRKTTDKERTIDTKEEITIKEIKSQIKKLKKRKATRENEVEKRDFVILYKQSKTQIARNYTENLERKTFFKKLEERHNCVPIYKKENKDKQLTGIMLLNAPNLQNLRDDIRRKIDRN